MDTDHNLSTGPSTIPKVRLLPRTDIFSSSVWSKVSNTLPKLSDLSVWSCHNYVLEKLVCLSEHYQFCRASLLQMYFTGGFSFCCRFSWWFKMYLYLHLVYNALFKMMLKSIPPPPHTQFHRTVIYIQTNVTKFRFIMKSKWFLIPCFNNFICDIFAKIKKKTKLYKVRFITNDIPHWTNHSETK